LFYICTIIRHYFTYHYPTFIMASLENITLKCTNYWFQIVLLYLATHVIMKEDMDVSIQFYNEKNTKNAIFATFLIEKEQFAIPYFAKTIHSASKKPITASVPQPIFVALDMSIQPSATPTLNAKKHFY
jgi:hypothetical protein